ncbi:MAG: ATP/GTP-binding protein [Clostridiales bacterium]|nr:ATP/GTP-binding protein [Clostridiales bacterium]
MHSEERFQKQLAKVVRRVTEDLAIQAVFVSGPTSSGKTTFSRRLAEAVRASGRLARVVSLDDYYKVDSVRYDAWAVRISKASTRSRPI